MINAPRVLIVAEHASAQFGGEAVLSLHYYRVLRARNVQVWLVVHERTRQELLTLFPADADRIYFVSDTLLHKTLWRLSSFLPQRLAGFTLGFAMRLSTQLAQRKVIKALVRSVGITVVHQPIPVSPKEPSLIYGFGVPVIIGPMNGGVDYPAAFAKLQGGAESFLLSLGRSTANAMNTFFPGKRKAALLLVANERTKAALPECLGSVPVQIVVENGVDIALWSKPKASSVWEYSDVTRYVYMGRLIEWKAVDLLISAFSKASAKYSMSLEIIGDGTNRLALEQLASNLKVLGSRDEVGKVHFSGWLSQVDCAHRLKNGDALVLPSLMECGGAVVLEAMALCKPVIATNWGGPADYLDETCGILVDPCSEREFIDGLACAMQRLAVNPQERVSMGLAGRDKILAHFDWEQKVTQMMKLYESLSRSAP
jgi:glycosyltransferase involved in cell wall biosynthesis